MINVTPTIQKIVLSAVILALVGFVVYSTLFSELELPEGVEATLTTATVGQDIIILSDKLKTVSFNKEILDSPIFKKLIDISATVNEVEKGRVNPFSAIGSN